MHSLSEQRSSERMVGATMKLQNHVSGFNHFRYICNDYTRKTVELNPSSEKGDRTRFMFFFSLIYISLLIPICTKQVITVIDEAQLLRKLILQLNSNF